MKPEEVLLSESADSPKPEERKIIICGLSIGAAMTVLEMMALEELSSGVAFVILSEDTRMVQPSQIPKDVIFRLDDSDERKSTQQSWRDTLQRQKLRVEQNSRQYARVQAGKKSKSGYRK